MRKGQFARLAAAVGLAALLVALTPPTSVHAVSYINPVPGCVAHAQAHFVGPPTEPHFQEEMAHWTAACQNAYWMHQGAMTGGCIMAGIAGGPFGFWTGSACALIVWG